jgi:DivIVA domain-containing protein
MSIEQLSTRFRLVRGNGYDPEEVDAALAHLETQNGALRSNVDELEERIRVLQAESDATGPPETAGPDPRDVGEALVLAQEFARGLKTKAQDEADRIIAVAKTDAKHIRADAEAARDRLREVEADYVRRIQGLQEKGRGYAEDLRATLSLFEEHLNTLPVPAVTPPEASPASPTAEVPSSGRFAEPVSPPADELPAQEGPSADTPVSDATEAASGPEPGSNDLTWQDPAIARPLVLGDEEDQGGGTEEPALPRPAWSGGAQ